MKVKFGVSVLSGTAFPHRRDLGKIAELVRIIDASGAWNRESMVVVDSTKVECEASGANCSLRLSEKPD